jgi:murein endopeptidase
MRIPRRSRWLPVAALALAWGLAVPASAVPLRCPKGTAPRQANVKKGETLAALATRTKTAADDLKRWNRLKSDVLRTGQNLRYCTPVFTPGSVGSCNAGRLKGGRDLDQDGDNRGPGFVLAPGRQNTWGTPSTVAAIRRATSCYRSRCPARKGAACPPVNIGDLSAKDGGHLGPHASHQSGRDVDLGYLTAPPQSKGYFDREASPANLNAKAQWALLGCLLDDPSVKFVFLSQAVVGALKTHAKKVPALKRYARFFGNGVLQPDTEHMTHLHVRFRCGKNDKGCKD